MCTDLAEDQVETAWPDAFVKLIEHVGQKGIEVRGQKKVIDEPMHSYRIYAQTKQGEGEGRQSVLFGFVPMQEGMPILQAPGIRDWPDELKQQLVRLTNDELERLGKGGGRELAGIYGRWLDEDDEDDGEDYDIDD